MHAPPQQCYWPHPLRPYKLQPKQRPAPTGLLAVGGDDYQPEALKLKSVVSDARRIAAIFVEDQASGFRAPGFQVVTFGSAETS